MASWKCSPLAGKLSRKQSTGVRIFWPKALPKQVGLARRTVCWRMMQGCPSPPSLHDTQPFCLPLSCPAVAFQAQTACIQLWLPVGLAQLEKSIAQRLQAAASMLLGQPAPDADSTVQLHPTSMPASAPAPISNPAQPKQPVSSSLNEADAQAAQRLCSQVHACLSLQFEYAAQRMHVIWGMHATASAGCMAHVTISCTCQRSCLRLCLPW